MAAINIRSVPEEIYRKVKVDAAKCGLTLREYVLQRIYGVNVSGVPERGDKPKKGGERIARETRSTELMETGDASVQTRKPKRGRIPVMRPGKIVEAVEQQQAGLEALKSSGYKRLVGSMARTPVEVTPIEKLEDDFGKAIGSIDPKSDFEVPVEPVDLKACPWLASDPETRRHLQQFVSAKGKEPFSVPQWESFLKRGY